MPLKNVHIGEKTYLQIKNRSTDKVLKYNGGMSRALWENLGGSCSLEVFTKEVILKDE